MEEGEITKLSDAFWNYFEKIQIKSQVIDHFYTLCVKKWSITWHFFGFWSIINRGDLIYGIL